MSDIEPRARLIAKLPSVAAMGSPALIAAVGERASYRCFEFFAANIRTRAAPTRVRLWNSSIGWRRAA